MKKNITVFIILLLFLFFAYAWYSSWQSKQMGAVSTSDSFYLNDKEVEKYKKDTLNGDQGASYKLVYYYDIYKNDYKEADRWLNFAVQHNHIWALETYGDRLCQQKKTEGLKYLSLACNLGDKDACTKAKDCKSQ